MAKQPSITVLQYGDRSEKGTHLIYMVIQVTNTMVVNIGASLDKRHVQELMDLGIDVTIKAA